VKTEELDSKCQERVMKVFPEVLFIVCCVSS